MMKLNNLIIDMDGVLWRGETALPGLVAFFETLDRLGIGYVLATNNATKTAVQYTEKLARLGVAMPAERILTSSQATAAYLSRRYPAGTAVYVVGEAGLHEAVAAAGFTVLQPGAELLFEEDRPAAVVVGLNRHVCYDDLAAAALLIQAGAEFIGSNPDPSLPAERGQMPGAGALLAFIQATTKVEPIIIGKPGPIIFQEALRRLAGDTAVTAIVGDRLTTDIAGGQAAGLKTILVLSGVSTRADVAQSTIQPDWTFADIKELTAALENISATTYTN
jgi:4-nitrophenyl phosphatase